MHNKTYPLAQDEEHPRDRPYTSEIAKIRKLIHTLGLIGLANNTKWNELLTVMRDVTEGVWYPKFRFNCLGTDYVSQWDGEWGYHVPVPFIQVRWFELSVLEVVNRGQLIPPEVIDHSDQLEVLVRQIGFDYEKGAEAIRIYGYSPRDRTDFKPFVV